MSEESRVKELVSLWGYPEEKAKEVEAQDPELYQKLCLASKQFSIPTLNTSVSKMFLVDLETQESMPITSCEEVSILKKYANPATLSAMEKEKKLTGSRDENLFNLIVTGALELQDRRTAYENQSRLANLVVNHDDQEKAYYLKDCDQKELVKMLGGRVINVIFKVESSWKDEKKDSACKALLDDFCQLLPCLSASNTTKCPAPEEKKEKPKKSKPSEGKEEKKKREKKKKEKKEKKHKKEKREKKEKKSSKKENVMEVEEKKKKKVTEKKTKRPEVEKSDEAPELKQHREKKRKIDAPSHQQEKEIVTTLLSIIPPLDVQEKEKKKKKVVIPVDMDVEKKKKEEEEDVRPKLPFYQELCPNGVAKLINEWTEAAEKEKEEDDDESLSLLIKEWNWFSTFPIC